MHSADDSIPCWRARTSQNRFMSAVSLTVFSSVSFSAISGGFPFAGDFDVTSSTQRFSEGRAQLGDSDGAVCLPLDSKGERVGYIAMAVRHISDKNGCAANGFCKPARFAAMRR